MSNKIVICADSTSDLSKELREKYQLDYVQMNYVYEDKEYPASLDWVCHGPKEFYDLMRNGSRIRTTQVAPDTFDKAFRGWLSEGKDVVYVACSSGLSGSYLTGKKIAADLEAEYPNAKVYCVDPKISSLGQGYLAILGAQMRDEGKSAQEIAEHLTKICKTVHQEATVGSLEYLRRAGRVKASSAFFGNIIGIRPILIADANGTNFAIKKAKGAVKARMEIVNDIKADVIHPEEQTLYISHADDIEAATALRDAIMKEVPFRDCVMSYIGPIVGASIGPGAIAAYFVGNEVTVKGE